MKIQVRTYTGKSARNYLQDVAELRIRVFSEYPYLYDGDTGYEKKYLKTYMNSPDYALVLAHDDDRVIGASTCLPLSQESNNLKQPFLDHGYDVSDFMYFGESVLLPAYRGQGIGNLFFIHRETYALNSGFNAATFCAVQRPEYHPEKPHDYRPLDLFWKKRGYRKIEHLTTTINWKDHSEDEESPKPMVFWIRQLK